MNLQNTKLSTISWILLGALLLQGCANYNYYEMGTTSELVAEINEKGESTNTKIYMNDGYKYSATNLHFQPDSSFWYAGKGVLPVNYSNADINKIVFTDRSKGAWDGFLLGAGLGAVIGVFLGWAVSDWGGADPRYSDDFPAKNMLAGAGIMAGIFGGLGITIGWVIGDKDFYIISNPKADERE